MYARDVMTTKVATVSPDTHVDEVARTLLERHVSAVPVVNDEGRVVGIVSEGDLMRRPEIGTERHPSWWLNLLAAPEERALTYVKTHGGHARQIMTRSVVAVGEDATLEEIAELLEKHHIKRVPVIRDGKLVGIVSRADLLHGLVARRVSPTVSASDETIRKAVESAIANAGLRSQFLSVIVAGGVVHLWGAVESVEEKQAAAVAAEAAPGVKDVRNDIGILPKIVQAVMGAE